MIESLNRYFQEAKARRRTGGANYLEMLEKTLPYGLNSGGVAELDQNVATVFDRVFRAHYENEAEMSSNRSITIASEDGLGRYRHLITSLTDFVPGLRVSLPEQNASCTLVDRFGAADFRSRLNAALLVSETVLVVDEIPKLITWNRNYKAHYLGYKEFDRHNFEAGSIQTADEL